MPTDTKPEQAEPDQAAPETSFSPELTPREKRDAAHHSSVKAHVVHEAVRMDGATELERSWSGLATSGLAAGLSMGFSFIAESLLRSKLPDAPWRPLIAKLGYSVGFLIVILGKQQLFTENTLTAVIPVLSRRTWKSVFRMMRLWAIVLAANLAGAHVVAWVLGNTGVFPPPVKEAMNQIAHEAMAVTPGLAI